jgi:hypothetical protein
VFYYFLLSFLIPVVISDSNLEFWVSVATSQKNRSASTVLQKESGCSLETETVHTFRTCIESGLWDQAEALLSILSVSDSDIPILQFMIKEQKFLEALEKKEDRLALRILRKDLTPLTRRLGNDQVQQLHHLARYPSSLPFN